MPPAAEYEDYVLADEPGSTEANDGDTSLDLITWSIAQLSDVEIEQMSQDDLLDLLRMSHSIDELQQATIGVRNRCRRATLATCKLALPNV